MTEAMSKRALARHAKITQRINSFKFYLIDLFDRYNKEYRTYEWLLAQRLEWMLGIESYKTLPLWAKEQLTGVWDTLMVLKHDRTTCWTHLLNGRRLCSDDAEEKRKLEGHYSELIEGASYRCWLIVRNDNRYYIPIVESERQAEFERMPQLRKLLEV